MNACKLTSTLAPLVRVGLLAALASGMSEAMATDIYKYKDARGQTVYSDQRPQGPAQVIRLDDAKEPTAEERARRENQQRAFEQIVTEHQEHEKARAAQEAAAKAERDKRCAAAKADNARFGYGGRMYRIDEQGNRVYYSAAEIDQRRAAAAHQMAESCPPQKSK